MKKRDVIMVWMMLLLFFAGCVGLLIAEKKPQKAPEANYDLNELPVLEINLEGVTLAEIQENDKSVKYKGNSAIFYNDSEISEFNDVVIKGRGNTTWTQPKKPYQIDLGEKANLLGLGKSSKWILLANYLDPSYLRNDTALYLARMIGGSFTSSGEFIELVINGENLGIYYLIPTIKVGKKSVDLRDDMGVIMELDNLHTDCGASECYYSDEGNILIVHDAVDKDNIEAAVGDFMKSYNELESTAASGDFEKVKDLIDVESFVQYFLVNEFTNNPDAYSTSWYMYKDGENDKIHAGPVWDFDLAFGNKVWDEWKVGKDSFPDEEMFRRIEAFGGEYINENGEKRIITEDKNIAKLVYRLMDITEFRDVVKQVFQEKMAGRETEVIGYLEQRKNKIYSAAMADGIIWKHEDFDSAVDELIHFISQRYEHFDLTYGNAKK